jgi:hypothetical protein
MSGKSYGSFSLLLPRRPGLVEDRREDKKIRRFSGRTFWTIHLPHPTEANVCCFCFIFFFPVYFPFALLSWIKSGRGHWDKGRRHISAFFFFRFPSRSSERYTWGEKGWLGFDRRSNTTYQTGNQGDETGWKHTITPLSLAHEIHLSFVKQQHTGG